MIDFTQGGGGGLPEETDAQIDNIENKTISIEDKTINIDTKIDTLLNSSGGGFDLKELGVETNQQVIIDTNTTWASPITGKIQIIAIGHGGEKPNRGDYYTYQGLPGELYSEIIDINQNDTLTISFDNKKTKINETGLEIAQATTGVYDTDTSTKIENTTWLTGNPAKKVYMNGISNRARAITQVSLSDVVLKTPFRDITIKDLGFSPCSYVTVSIYKGSTPRSLGINGVEGYGAGGFNYGNASSEGKPGCVILRWWEDN